MARANRKAARRSGVSASARKAKPRKVKPRKVTAKRTKAKKAKAKKAKAKVVVVNMIPRSLSGEANQDSEPTIAVNPANPQQIVGTAFTPDPMAGGQAPIYVSSDGGNTWLLNFIVPSRDQTADITVAFSSTSNNLYAGIIVMPIVNNTPR